MDSISRTLVSAILLVAVSTVAMADDRSPTAVDVGETSEQSWSARLERSYQVPFNRSAFGFLGVFIGPAQVSGIRTGFAVAPPAATGYSARRTRALTYRHTTLEHDTSSTGADAETTVLSVTSTALFKFGYAVLW